MPKILIVEDDKFLRELLAKKLQDEGLEIVQAIDGEEGVKKAEEELPDLLLLDLILPGINGFDVLKKLKENPKTSALPVIVLSNLGQKEDVERALTLGAKDYLIKANFTLEEIFDKIKKYL
jgi:DNA-binding response OmpR family regulator